MFKIKGLFSKNPQIKDITKMPPLRNDYVRPDYVAQSDQDSIVSNGFYDMNNISPGEKSVVIQVVSNTERKYPNKFKSVGLYNEGYPIMYKPRYLIFQVLISKYENSANAVDQFAVALAYTTKGSLGRKKAIEHLEKAMLGMSQQELYDMDKYTVLWLAFNEFSKVYEKEKQYELALLYAKTAVKLKGFVAPYDVTHPADIWQKVDINKSIEYYESLLNDPAYDPYYPLIQKELKQKLLKQKKGYKYIPQKRKPDLHAVKFEEELRNAVKIFL